MREIKFRALGLSKMRQGWNFGSSKIEKYFNTDKRNNHMFLTTFVKLLSGGILDKNTRCQWTGLLDKNSVEIYEGDIVNFQHIDDYGYMTNVFQNGFYRGVVKWGEHYPAFDIFDIKDNSTFGFDCNIFSMESDIVIEVIGNIYENKELLNTDG